MKAVPWPRRGRPLAFLARPRPRLAGRRKSREGMRLAPIDGEGGLKKGATRSLRNPAPSHAEKIISVQQKAVRFQKGPT